MIILGSSVFDREDGSAVHQATKALCEVSIEYISLAILTPVCLVIKLRRRMEPIEHYAQICFNRWCS